MKLGKVECINIHQLILSHYMFYAFTTLKYKSSFDLIAFLTRLLDNIKCIFSLSMSPDSTIVNRDANGQKQWHLWSSYFHNLDMSMLLINRKTSNRVRVLNVRYIDSVIDVWTRSIIQLPIKLHISFSLVLLLGD